MILIVASEVDASARSVASAWPGEPAVVLSPRDLCSRGWQIEPGRLQSGNFVAGGRVLPVNEISGAITLLPFVFAEELVDIKQSDRPYVSAELTALMLYFLANIEAKVVNRPGPHTLCGPDWRYEQWIHKCREVGIRTETWSRDSRSLCLPTKPAQPTRSVVVVGDRCVTQVEADLQAKAVKLAADAAVSFLQINLTDTPEGEIFHSVYLTPNLGDPVIRAELQRYFSEA